MVSQNRQSEKIAALLGGVPGPELQNKPMPLEEELSAEAEFQRERWAETSRLNRAMLAPLHKIIADDEEALAAVRTLSKSKPRKVHRPPKASAPRIESPIRGGSILAFRAPPFDDSWDAGSGSNSVNTNHGVGGGFDSDGTFNVDTQVNSDSGSVWGGGGVAVWFQPVADNTYVRVGPAARGLCSWDDNSWGYTAHNNALIGVLVESWDLNGEAHRIDVDRRISQWSDGTGWEEEHGYNNQFTVWFPADTFFLADASRWYKVWTWAKAWCDAEGSGLFGSSANADMEFDTFLFVFEQFT
jgi:hypothetical protein